MFESLQENLERAFKVLKGEGKITEINVSATLKEVLRALTRADVNYKTANDFIKRVKTIAIGQNIITAVKPKEMMMKIIYDELVKLMGEEVIPLNLSGNPTVILMSGLQGSGKTTFSGKIVNKLKKRGDKQPLLVAGDVYRPAAIEQLKIVGESVGVPVYTEEGNKNPVEIAKNAIRYAKEHHHNLVVIDTAGRLAVDEEMMDEIAAIKEAVNPQEILFVVDSMTGQDAVNTAKAFNDRLNFDGVVLTKLDGDTKGGAAVSIRSVVDKPIKFIGSGEKMEDIEEFDPKGMASRILGQGDLMSLAKKAQDLISEDEAKKLESKIRANKFDFEDFLAQIQKIKKMGSLKDIASMIPGLNKHLKDVEINDDAFKGIEAIIGSMTPYERQNPKVINASRRQRIAKGSGTTIQEVNRLLTQFENTRNMMHSVSNMSPRQMMQTAAQARRRRR